MQTTFIGRDDLVPDSPHLNRLANLICLLRTIPADTFSITQWVGSKYIAQMSPLLQDVIRQHIETINVEYQFPTCGTVACACGHAGLHPWFRNQGFTLTPHGSMRYTGQYPNGYYVDWHAIQYFFGLEGCEAMRLFSENQYVTGPNTTIDQIIERIQQTFPTLKDF